MDKKKPIVIGDVTSIELKKYSKEFPVHGNNSKLIHLAELIKKVANHFNMDVLDVVQMVKNDPHEFRLRVRQIYTEEVETARLVNLANMVYRIKEGLKLKLANASNETYPYLPYGTTDIHPIDDLNPERIDSTIKSTDLENELKTVLREL